LLDEGEDERPYTKILLRQIEAIRDAERTPSARILAEMRETKESFFEFAMRRSEQYLAYFKEQSLPDTELRHFTEVSRQSIAQQKAIEAADEIPFDEYLKRYSAQT
jgi:glutamate--cysteine ligase